VTPPEFVPETNPGPEQVQYLEDRIYEYNAAATGIADGDWLAIFVRDDSGRIVAGICGNTWGGCCEIRQFWVEESQRGRGVGTGLLAAAEHEARRRGCTQIMLMTFSFQAPAFYARRGFITVTVLDGYRGGHRNLLMRKRLDQARRDDASALGDSSMPRGFAGGFRACSWALLALRLVVGFGFLAHGWAKWSRGPAGFARLLAQIGVPLPQLSAWVVTLSEVLGGIAILAGLFVAIAGIPLIVSMLVAMFTVQLRFGFSSVNTIGLTADGPVFGPPGYEINLLYIGALLVLAFAGPSAWSADAWLARRRAAGSPV
jgi:putative oxidoreductase